jgi:cyclopropane-fatty-acyl-phospholipid synthase
LANRDKAIELYDERFVRIWECYLAGCEAAFRAKQMTVFQVQLRKKNSPMPMTREYIYRDAKSISSNPIIEEALTRRAAALTDEDIVIRGKNNHHAKNKA